MAPSIPARFSFVSLLSDSGVPLENISRLLGHSNTTVLYAPTLDAAQSVAKDASTAGYSLRAEVGKPSQANPDSWPCCATELWS
ncbi:hypothetical protein GCM10010404_74110 [Nonomuraea africana]|uniref:Tyr recombinase domain-containing protein n=1 Tax=Nonomuraea africana TaxID=46171 RepID=A0ABR9K779_9ACTN|nr:hypothetical protein [Nonomuraea africana]